MILRDDKNYTYTCLMALCPGLPGWAGSRKVKPVWILLKQETVSDSGISWAVCKSVPRSRQITTPAPHHSVFYRPDALPAAQPTLSKHWRHIFRPWFRLCSARENKENLDDVAIQSVSVTSEGSCFWWTRIEQVRVDWLAAALQFSSCSSRDQ